jgi:hypothetical protein
MEPRVLVIGSRDHERADCIDWLQSFPNIEDYDSIVIDLPSLTQEIYDKIQTKICEMREPIATVFNTDREIFCIMSKVIQPSPPPRSSRTIILSVPNPEYVPPTNYEWFPVNILINDQKTGTSFNVCNERFSKYFQFVHRWDLEIIAPTEEPVPIPTDTAKGLVCMISPIAMNKSKKPISGSLERGGLRDGVFVPYKGAIHLLPGPTKCDDNQIIETILDIICGEKTRKVPIWRNDIEVPRVRELEVKVADDYEKIGSIQRKISTLRDQIQEWDSYRDLLTETGTNLEDIVQRALRDIGLETKKTEKSFPADLRSNQVAVEVTGIKGSVGVSSEKVIQTGRFKELYHKGEKIILVANTYMDLPPQDRRGKKDFSTETVKYFESLSICCLTTMTLYKLWIDVMTEKRRNEEVKNKLLSKNGELTLDAFK